jgi:hypothetical protein
MIRPHLELFLIGPLKNEMWQRELAIAQSRQLVGDRPGRAWMFFEPVPAKVSLPSPRPERISGADRLAKSVSACLFAAGAGYLGWVLLWHRAFLGLLAYMAAFAGGALAAAADLEWRFMTDRHEQSRIPDQSAPTVAMSVSSSLSSSSFFHRLNSLSTAACRLGALFAVGGEPSAFQVARVRPHGAAGQGA